MEHPYGVQPEGNALLDLLSGHSRQQHCRNPGLGPLARLSDPLVLHVLSFLGTSDLGRLSSVSRACYVFSHVPELWKALAISDGRGAVSYAGTWRATAIMRSSGRLPPSHVPRHVAGFYSDHLFNEHVCATAPINPSWVAMGNRTTGSAAIARIPLHDLTLAAFNADFDEGCRPVIIEGCASAWRATAHWDSPGYLAGAALPGSTFDAGGFQFSMANYLAYSAAVSAPGGGEDQPLYLFDPRFAEKAPTLKDDYAVPEYFGDDAFAALGAVARPDNAWLIAGPLRSGSVWHVDPNGTSAFNACVVGSKLWLMAPPDGPPPPGVIASADGAMVATAMCPMEWMLDYWDAAVRRPARSGGRGGRATGTTDGAATGHGGKRRPARDDSRHVPPQSHVNGRMRGSQPLLVGGSGNNRTASSAASTACVVTGVCHAGDVIFVPRGWWHMVLNIDVGANTGSCIAVTHNFVSRAGLSHTLRFLRERPFAVSGVDKARRATLADELRAALSLEWPEALAQAKARLQTEDDAAAAAATSAGRAAVDLVAAERHRPVDAPPVEASVRVPWRDVIAPAGRSESAACALAGGLGAQSSFTFAFPVQGS